MNRYRLLLFVTLLLAGLSARSQTTTRVVRGVVRDTTGQALPGATIRLVSPHDTTGAITHDDGTFEIPHVTEPRFNITVYMMSYAGFKHDYNFSATDTATSLGTIVLRSNVQQLKAVTVKGSPLAVTFRGDTVEYNAAAYQVRDGSNVSEVVRQLPGVEMDHNGKVTAQGKEVTRVRLNGKDYFGADVSKALKNLPASIIEKLQVIDDYGEQANLTGIKAGEPQKVLNLTLKPDKSSGVFGSATVGVGTSNLHLGGLNISRFKGERQLSLSGDMNNSNAGPFSFGDNGGIGGSDGSNTARSFGFNYRDALSKSLVGYGSINYGDNSSLVTGTTAQQTIDGSYINLNNQQNRNTGNSRNYSLSYNLEYKPDTLNQLRFSPGINWSKGQTESVSQFHIAQNNLHPVKISDGTNTNFSDNDNTSVNASLMYNHRFRKKGRNFNINFSYSNSQVSSQQDVRTLTHLEYVDSLAQDTALHQQVRTPNSSTSFNSSVSYTEPLGKISVLEFNYNFSESTSSSSRETWNIDPADVKTRVDSQSNNYNYKFLTQRISLRYDLRGQKHKLLVGLSALPQVLSGTSTHPDFSTRNAVFSFSPSLRYSYNISNSKSLSLSYSGNPSQPGFMQLMPVTDLTNPQYPVVGNPDLKPSFSQAVNLNFRSFNVRQGNSFFVGITGNLTNNSVVSNILNDSAHLAGMGSTVIQETRYINADGARTANVYYSYTQPFLQRKLTLTYGGTVTYGNNISYVNDLAQRSANTSWNQSLRLRLNLPKLMDVEASGSYSRNNTHYSTTGGFNNTTNSVALEIYARHYIGQHLILGWNATKNVNSGYSSGVGANPMVLNAYVECQFLKGNRAALRIQGFDLLNENTGVYHSVSGAVITDTRNNRLSRYGMLSFSYRFDKFGF